MPGGRPTLYTDELLERARSYLDWAKENNELPTIEGFALHLDISRETVYAWKDEKDKQEFSDIYSKVFAVQGNQLIQRGLDGTYNSTIAKLILTKHNYTDKQDITSNGNTLPIPILGIADDETQS